MAFADLFATALGTSLTLKKIKKKIAAE